MNKTIYKRDAKNIAIAILAAFVVGYCMVLGKPATYAVFIHMGMFAYLKVSYMIEDRCK